MKKMLWLLGLLLCVWQVPATVFGPAQAIRCPGCKQITLKEYSLLSGNTYDAVLWSDFKLVAPSMPQPPFLVKCPACGTLLLPIDTTAKLRTMTIGSCRRYLPANACPHSRSA